MSPSASSVTFIPARTTTRERRRVRVARTQLARIQQQREQLATTYGAATTSQQRFNAVAFALRTAAAPGRHQPDPEELEQQLDQLTYEMKSLLEQLQLAQQAKADETIRVDQRRVTRNERRRGDGRTTHNPTHPAPERPGHSTAAS